jgi:hypothetical protein
MKTRTVLSLLAVVLALASIAQSSVRAQVVERREDDANPAIVLFRATLFGAGTGLLLGGAYALVEEDDDLSTGEILKWGAAGGAAGGAIVGLLHWMTRSEPQGSAEEVSSGDPAATAPRVLAPGLAFAQRRDSAGKKQPELRVNLVNLAF